jgi:flagellin-like protein
VRRLVKSLVDEKGISPVIATILLIGLTAVAAGVIAGYVAGIFVPYARVACTVDEDGLVIDVDPGITDNFLNGTMRLTWTVMTDDIDDVEDPEEPLTVTIEHPIYGWSVTASLAGGTTGEGDYGGEVRETGTDTVLDNQGNSHTVNWTLWGPVTTPGGEIDIGMTLNLTIELATFQQENACWDEGDRIYYTIGPEGISGDFYSLFRLVRD